MSLSLKFVGALSALAVMVFAGAGPLVAAGEDAAAEQETTLEVGLRGFDVVAFFTSEKPVKGDPSIAAVLDNTEYHFVSDANRAAFLADPAKYLPQYDGYCAFALSKGVKKRGDPNAFTIHDDKLYLTVSEPARDAWRKDPDQRIEEANGNWDTHNTEAPSPAP